MSKELTKVETGSSGSSYVHLPKDEGAHPEMITEWWYSNFTLRDSNGKQYGAMAAYFNNGPRVLSISDIDARQFYSEVSFSTPNYAQGPLYLRWGSNDSWFRNKPDSYSYHLQSNGSKISLNIDLDSLKPPLLVNGDGLIKWSFGSSYYYSLTRLRAKGQIELLGKAVDVDGIGWMDHQWMDFIPFAVIRCYEWFSVQLDNNTEVVFWQATEPDGSLISQLLTMVYPDGSAFYTKEFALQRVDTWISPRTQCEYGTLWKVREQTQTINLEVKALFPEQEIKIPITLPGFRPAFWEGKMTVSGQLAGKTVSGTGYAELFRPHSS
jgi:predicted secreted hydrolase